MRELNIFRISIVQNKYAINLIKYIFLETTDEKILQRLETIEQRTKGTQNDDVDKLQKSISKIN